MALSVGAGGSVDPSAVKSEVETRPVLEELSLWAVEFSSLYEYLRGFLAEYAGLTKYGVFPETYTALCTKLRGKAETVLDDNAGKTDAYFAYEAASLVRSLPRDGVSAANRAQVLAALRSGVDRMHALLVSFQVDTCYPVREHQRVLASMVSKRRVLESQVWADDVSMGRYGDFGLQPARVADVQFAYTVVDRSDDDTNDWGVYLRRTAGVDEVVEDDGEFTLLVDLDEFVVYKGNAFCPWDVLDVLEREEETSICAREEYGYAAAVPPSLRVGVVGRLGPWPTKEELKSVCPDLHGWAPQQAVCRVEGPSVRVLSEGSLPVGLQDAARVGGPMPAQVRADLLGHDLDSVRRVVMVFGRFLDLPRAGLEWCSDGGETFSYRLTSGTITEVGPLRGDTPWELAFGAVSGDDAVVTLGGRSYVADKLVVHVRGRVIMRYRGPDVYVIRKPLRVPLDPPLADCVVSEHLPVLSLTGSGPRQDSMLLEWKPHEAALRPSTAWFRAEGVAGVRSYSLHLPPSMRGSVHVVRVYAGALESVGLPGAVVHARPTRGRVRVSGPLFEAERVVTGVRARLSEFMGRAREPGGLYEAGHIVVGWDSSVGVATRKECAVFIEVRVVVSG